MFFELLAELAMNFDDLFIAIIIAGIGLTVAYLRAEYIFHRGFKAAEHKKLIVQRELHANRLRPKQEVVRLSECNERLNQPRTCN